MEERQAGRPEVWHCRELPRGAPPASHAAFWPKNRAVSTELRHRAAFFKAQRATLAAPLAAALLDALDALLAVDGAEVRCAGGVVRAARIVSGALLEDPDDDEGEGADHGVNNPVTRFADGRTHLVLEQASAKGREDAAAVKHAWLEAHLDDGRRVGVDCVPHNLDIDALAEGAEGRDGLPVPLHVFDAGAVDPASGERISTGDARYARARGAKRQTYAKWRAERDRQLRAMDNPQVERSFLAAHASLRREMVDGTKPLAPADGGGEEAPAEWPAGLHAALTSGRGDDGAGGEDGEGEDSDEELAGLARELKANPFLARKGAAEAEAAAGDTRRLEELAAERAAREQAAEAHRHKEAGTAAFKAGDIEGALAHYGDALALLPERSAEAVACCSNRAQCALRLQDYALALEESDSALRRNPKHAKSRYRKGLSLQGLGRLAEAKAELRRLTRADPENSEAALLLDKLLKATVRGPGAEPQ